MKKDKSEKFKESKIPNDWFRIGNNELEFAKLGFNGSGAFYPSICFMCQQTAEKYLKGFLLFSKKTYPKIHDLTELIKLCGKVDSDFLKFLGEADYLSQYYLVVRYPIEYKEASRKEAKEAIEAAEKIINFIKKKT